jgi:acylphosphatase
MATTRIFGRALLSLLAGMLLCMGPQAAGGEPKAQVQALPPPKVDEQARRISLAGQVAKQNVYEELKGAVEYLICVPGGKAYESLFVCPVDLQALYDALVKLGVKPGRAATEEDGKYVLPSGGGVRIFVEWDDGKQKRRARAETFVFDTIHNKPLQELDWTFTGSREAKDPETGKSVIQAVMVKNMVSVHQLDATVLLQNPLEDAAKVHNRYKANFETLPKEGTAVTIIFEPAPPPKVETPAGSRRIHLLITGTVQGVGFREFTQRSARQLGIKGWARNLPTGEVELEAEGLEAAVQEFEGKVNKGPRSAKVEKVQAGKASSEPLAEFEIRETPAK